MSYTFCHEKKMEQFVRKEENFGYPYFLVFPKKKKKNADCLLFRVVKENYII